MKEIYVHHSLWKNLLLIAGCLAFVAMGIFLIQRGENALMSWLGILFFGGGGLFKVYLVLRDRVGGHPYLIITDEKVLMNSWKTWEVRFADVESFSLIGVGRTKFIGINYKKDVAKQKLEDTNQLGHAVRQMNTRLVGSQEALPASDLSIKPQQLYDLLNERLRVGASAGMGERSSGMRLAANKRM